MNKGKETCTEFHRNIFLKKVESGTDNYKKINLFFRIFMPLTCFKVFLHIWYTELGGKYKRFQIIFQNTNISKRYKK